MFNDEKDEVVQLFLDDIIPNRFQPREVFDEKALKELAVSIKEHGVIQPIIVRSVNGKYEIIAGERRYKASALAGLTKIPAIIRDLDDKESSKVALLENLQRKNLNPIEEARTYQKILEIDEMTQEELAKTMGKSQSAVANKIRLLSLPEEIQDSLLKEQISERHARTLLNIPDAKKQKEMLDKIINTKMSVRNLEEEIKKEYPKEIDNKENIESTEENNEAPESPSLNNFVNKNPLMPTADLPEDTSNYGKVTIAPPSDEDSDNPPKFLNYNEFANQGQTEQNNVEDDEGDNDGGDINIPTTISPININEIKETSKNIEPTSSADLDGLLNINGNMNIENNDNFITPAEKIVKTDTVEENEKPEDYFKTPDLSALEVPSIKKTTNPDLVSIPQQQESKPTYSLEEATEKIKNLYEDLKNNGIKITLDEMDFKNSYQVIIKIEKDEE